MHVVDASLIVDVRDAHATRHHHGGGNALGGSPCLTCHRTLGRSFLALEAHHNERLLRLAHRCELLMEITDAPIRLVDPRSQDGDVLLQSFQTQLGVGQSLRPRARLFVRAGVERF